MTYVYNQEDIGDNAYAVEHRANAAQRFRNY
jgi:hypothetical protein